MSIWSPLVIAGLIWALVPLLAFGLAGARIGSWVKKQPRIFRVLFPALFGMPYVWVALNAAALRLEWLAVYFLLPVGVAAILADAARRDPEQRGTWGDFAILLVLGCAVDLRWFDVAWPAHLSVLSKLILLDTGLYGFGAIRQLREVGYDLRVRGQDFLIGLCELMFYAPIAVPLGLLLGFLHWRGSIPKPGLIAETWLFTFFFIAIPEEIYFRGWMQNLLERRVGGTWSLLITAAIFGLAHFNKRATSFNWQYVLLAAVAGIFYGRAWGARRRIASSAITHATVDAVWSLWL